jgi:hypothetical protein
VELKHMFESFWKVALPYSSVDTTSVSMKYVFVASL